MKTNFLSFLGVKPQTSILNECIAGMTTFFTMSYIIFVIPDILAPTGMPIKGVLTATVIITSLSTCLMGCLTKLPYALAPGLGISTFFSYTLIIQKGLSWQTALGATTLSGILFILLTLFNVRELIVKVIPESLRNALPIGMGLFIAFIGLKKGHMIQENPHTMVQACPWTTELVLFLIGMLITLFFLIRGLKAAFLIGIASTSLISFFIGKITIPDAIFSCPDFSLFGQLDISGSFKYALLSAVFTLIITDLFDSLSSFLALSKAAGLMDESGQPKNIRGALLVDAISTTFSGIVGTPSGTVFIESAAGIQAGGRTGLCSLVTGLCFLPFLFVSNLALCIPPYAIAPSLVIVGILMMQNIRHLNFQSLDEAVPAMCCILLIPLTFSITQGVLWSILCFVTLKLFKGKAKDIHPITYVISLISLIILMGF